jgi:hypothetical protein
MMVWPRVTLMLALKVAVGAMVPTEAIKIVAATDPLLVVGTYAVTKEPDEVFGIETLGPDVQ